MASAVQIRRIDPFIRDQVDAWWHAYADARRADMGENALIWSLEERRAELQQDSATTRRQAYVAVRDDAVVGSGSLALPLKDNLHIAMMGVNVPSQHRRRGVGSALLEHIETEAAREGRSTMRTDIFWPVSLPADGTGAANREFARRHGYDVALGDVQNRLDLPVADSLLDALIPEAPDDGYTLRSWVGPVPDAFVAEWAALDALLDTEAPTGDLEVEASTSDVTDFRADEAMQAAQRRTSYGTIALAADGRVAAYTQIVVSGDDGNAYQWGTLVRREDRGHGLGLRIKLENLRMLQHHSPDTPRIYTFNAESNTHMLAVNTRLGFRVSARMGELHKKLG
ncbi:GNAT family N-acetyltransferase [Microbacterium sp. ARD32]|uniref:GNAT family N-acetyltransferase n=1 Tax=Microbacterium sp. ARD32 TaxID=2962577 RepID=UPI002881E8BF|nr:GNAT family N-acetyltransferase [Microbacterium sp. ARD32]MDT0156289.1 GNAT family N-acetyltransferase [Microbacterium sp. ARD32]